MNGIIKSENLINHFCQSSSYVKQFLKKYGCTVLFYDSVGSNEYTQTCGFFLNNQGRLFFWNISRTEFDDEILYFRRATDLNDTGFYSNKKRKHLFPKTSSEFIDQLGQSDDVLMS